MSIALVDRVPAWAAPTVRATPLTPLVAATAVFLVVGALVELSGEPAGRLLALAAAGAAAALVAGLHDPAAALLEAVPTSASSRRAHRLALLVPLAAVLWLGLLGAAHLADDWTSGWPLGPVSALAAVGIAVAVWAPAGSQAAWGAAAPMAWFALAHVVTPSGSAEGALALWQTHPWTVTAAAVAAITLGARR